MTTSSFIKKPKKRQACRGRSKHRAFELLIINRPFGEAPLSKKCRTADRQKSQEPTKLSHDFPMLLCPNSRRLTLQQLGTYDDILTDTLIDGVSFPSTDLLKPKLILR
jgi:hypothetical protein